MENLSSPNLNWSTFKKVAFRFSFIFLILFIIIENNEAYPFWNLIMKYPTEILHKIIPWIGKNILHLSYNITVFTNGSGDTTYDYVIVFTISIIAFVGTSVWSVLDRARANYTKLYYWLTLAVRYYIGLTLISYGLIKIIKLQFPAPSFYRLTQNLGDASPMGLAWTFLGFSDGYNLFMGLIEVAAVLLLFRRTMTIGAIITLMSTANVMAVNYFYDVPVKILSTALVVMTLFLLLKDARRLIKLFFTGESVSLPVIIAPVIDKKWLRVIKISLKTLLIGYVLIYGLIDVLEARKKYVDAAPKSTLYGLYNVDVFIANNDTLPPLLTDSVRWNQFLVEWKDYAQVRYMGDSMSWFSTTLDTISQKIDFTFRKDSTIRYSFKYEIPNADKFNLKGIIQKDSVSIFMTRKNLQDFRLMNRGFHWINESQV